MHLLCDLLQTERPVPAGIEAGYHREEDLRGAHVGRRLLPAYVLLPGLEGKPIGDADPTVMGDTDEAAGEAPDMLFLGGDEPGMGPAVSQGDTEPLGASPPRCQRPTPPVV